MEYALATAWETGGLSIYEGVVIQMNDYRFFLNLAIIMIFSKFF